jgi:hypothetical protein
MWKHHLKQFFLWGFLTVQVVVWWSFEASRPRSSLARENNFSNEELLRIWEISFLVGCNMLIIFHLLSNVIQKKWQILIINKPTKFVCRSMLQMRDKGHRMTDWHPEPFFIGQFFSDVREELLRDPRNILPRIILPWKILPWAVLLGRPGRTAQGRIVEGRIDFGRTDS